MIAIWSFAALPPADDGGFLFVRRLADNDSDQGVDGLYSINSKFNPSMAIIIVVLLSAFFFLGFFSIYIRRCSTDGGGTRAGARSGAGGGGNNNAQGFNREATRGLDKSVIESFPVFSYNLVKGLKAQTKGSECAVCLNDFEDDEMLRLLPKCSHAFHPECIDMWLCSHTTCPVCRTELLPTDESNPTGTDIGIVEPQTPPEEVVIVVDDGAGVVSRHGSVRSVRVSDETSTKNAEAAEAGDDVPNLGPGFRAGEKIRRSHSTGHSLVRLRKDLEKPTEWYIATPGGLTPGLYRSCSFVAMHHSRSQGASSSKAAAACPKAADAGTSGQESCRGDPRTRSERWGGIASMNPAAILRSFSERPAPQQRDQRPVAIPQQDRMAFLKKKFNWLTGRDREESRDGSVSSRHADHGGPAVTVQSLYRD